MTANASMPHPPMPSPFQRIQRSVWHDVRYVLKLAYQMLSGALRFRTIQPCITVFGSARLGESHPYYTVTHDLCKALSKRGYPIMTGAGPGLMEAANRGAQAGGSLSIGCGIHIPTEQHHNPFLDHLVECRFFFVRKLLMTRYALGFVGVPGGYGTLDEIFEMLNLIVTEHLEPFPVVLVGTEYWQPLMEFLRSTCLSVGTINQSNLDCILCTDDLDLAVEHIDACCRRPSPNQHPLAQEMGTNPSNPVDPPETA